MVKTPQELTKPTEEDRAKVRRLEQQIDAALERGFEPGGQRRVTISLPDGLYPGSRVYCLLKSMYTHAGWNVEYHSDQREGAWMEFTPSGSGEFKGVEYER